MIWCVSALNSSVRGSAGVRSGGRGFVSSVAFAFQLVARGARQRGARSAVRRMFRQQKAAIRSDTECFMAMPSSADVTAHLPLLHCVQSKFVVCDVASSGVTTQLARWLPRYLVLPLRRTQRIASNVSSHVFSMSYSAVMVPLYWMCCAVLAQVDGTGAASGWSRGLFKKKNLSFAFEIRPD